MSELATATSDSVFVSQDIPKIKKGKTETPEDSRLSEEKSQSLKIKAQAAIQPAPNESEIEPGVIKKTEIKRVKRQPVTTVDDLLDAVGTTKVDEQGQIFIRGGRAGEVSYIIDSNSGPLGGPKDAARLNLVSGSQLSESTDIESTTGSDEKLNKT